jgi:hypothetical protein
MNCVELEEADCMDVFAPDTDIDMNSNSFGVRNISFEPVSASLVDTYVTELGNLTPSDIIRCYADVRESLRYILLPTAAADGTPVSTLPPSELLA